MMPQDNQEELYQLDHDAVCMSQANQLLTMGCLEHEVAVYGCACLQDGQMMYYLSQREESMRRFRLDACLHNRYVTPSHYFCQRYDLLTESEAEIDRAFRLMVAQKLHQRYPRILLEAVASLNETPCANDGFPLLQDMCAALANGFDPNALCLFADLLDLLLQGRRINREAYVLMQQWLQAEQAKMAVETIARGAYQRTFSGFAYERSDGTVGYFADALRYLAEERRSALLGEGRTVTPILTITYTFDAFTSPRENKQQFLTEAAAYLNADYLALMRRFRQLPPSIDACRYQTLAADIAACGQRAAVDAFRAYGCLCGVC